MLVGHIRAVKDVWIIGDHLARDAYPYLQQMDQDHKRGCENYLQENYDHYAYFPCFTDKNVLAMIRNAFVEGLNRRLKLPNAVIILFGEQLLREDPLFLPSEFERKLKWLIRELDVNIKIRKGSLPPKAYNLGQPRIMFVQAFRTCKSSLINPDQLLKFNNLLRRTCITKAIYTIPIDDTTLRCFERNGKTQITEGFKFLWQEIINGLKLHDEKDRLHEVNQLVDQRLKEMNWDKQSKQERRDHTVESVQRNMTGAFRDLHREDRSKDRFPTSSDRSRNSNQWRHKDQRSVRPSDNYRNQQSRSYHNDFSQHSSRRDHFRKQHR